ncbi:unnamed protein product [Adineta steineri]|uniref:Uncharacterized protein n=1 Tax=Adineta steineri TaxID=433720 RepID=A0A814VVB5_9BILA|nr:unnamed protein product [Adineta steineri]
MKFQVLYNNGIISFSPDGGRLRNELLAEFNEICEIIVELNNLDSMFFRLLPKYKLRNKLKHCRNLIHRIIGNHLTQESHNRIDSIFNFISTDEFLTYMFDSNSALNHAIIEEITDDLYALMRNVIIRE